MSEHMSMNDEIDSAAQQEAKALQTAPVLTAKRAILILAVFFLAQAVITFVVGAIIGAYIAIAQGISEPTAVTEAFKPFDLSVSMIGLFLAALIALRMTRNTFGGASNAEGLATIGWQRASIQRISVAALAGFVVSLFYAFVLVPAFPPPDDQQWGPLVTAATSGGWPFIQWAFVGLFLAPPIEEFVFRGVLFSGLSKSCGVLVSALIVTVLFLLLHLPETLNYWPAWVGVGMLAVTTVVIRIQTGSLLPAIAAHASYNLLLVLAVLFASA
jgi:uncharacterized protein